MQLRDLAETCDRLEATRSRRTLADLVADLLRRAGAQDREPIVYLLQAALRPPYEGVELGVGDKLLIYAIAASYGASTTTVERRYQRLGDLGLVAAALAPKGRPRGRTVREMRTGPYWPSHIPRGLDRPSGNERSSCSSCARSARWQPNSSCVSHRADSD